MKPRGNERKEQRLENLNMNNQLPICILNNKYFHGMTNRSSKLSSKC